MPEAEEKTKREDDMETHETATLFNIADQVVLIDLLIDPRQVTSTIIFQNKSGKLDKVELADFIRLVRLSAIRFATDHFKVISLLINKIDDYYITQLLQEFDANRDRLVTVDELAQLIETKYHVPFDVTKEFFAKVL